MHFNIFLNLIFSENGCLLLMHSVAVYFKVLRKIIRTKHKEKKFCAIIYAYSDSAIIIHINLYIYTIISNHNIYRLIKLIFFFSNCLTVHI